VVHLADVTLYVGTDISERVNRSRFYDTSGNEVGVRVESQNDLPGSCDLAKQAISLAVAMVGIDPIAKVKMAATPGKRGCHT
jgi:hypothetical protein